MFPKLVTGLPTAMLCGVGVGKMAWLKVGVLREGVDAIVLVEVKARYGSFLAMIRKHARITEEVSL